MFFVRLQPVRVSFNKPEKSGYHSYSAWKQKTHVRPGRFPDTAQKIDTWYPKPIWKRAREVEENIFQILCIRPINNEFQKFLLLFKNLIFEVKYLLDVKPWAEFFVSFWRSYHLKSENTFISCMYLANIHCKISHDLNPHHLDLRPFWTT